MFFDPQFPFQPSKKIYYGYVIIVCAIVAATVTAPGQTIGVSVFIDYFIQSFHITRTQLSIAYMIGTITGALFLGTAGRMLDKKGSRYMAFWCSIFLGMTLIGLSHIDYLASRVLPKEHYYHIFLVLALLGIGFFCLRFLAQGVLSVVSRAVILKWFVAARGRVSGLVGIFATLAMSASPPVFNYLIRIAGWRNAYVILGVIIAGFFSVLFWLFFRDTPESCGLPVDGPLFTKTQEPHQLLTERNWTLREAQKTKTFWVFNLALSVYAFLMTGVSFNITSIFQVAGRSRAEAISVFIPSACVSIIVKLISGYLCDHPFWRYRLKYQLSFYLAAIGSLCLGLALLPIFSFSYYIVVVSMGISTGLYITLSSVCWGSFFGRLHAGQFSGVTTGYAIFMSAFGPVLFSIFFDLTKNYEIPLIFSMVLTAVFLILSFSANKPEFIENE